MKTNKQIKQMIASVTGGEWATRISGKPYFYWFVTNSYGVVGMFRVHDKPVSIKASEVK